MKITYNLTKKEFRHYLNLALGIMHNKKRFLKHQKISSYTDICFKNLFIVLLIIPLINILDTFHIAGHHILFNRFVPFFRKI